MIKEIGNKKLLLGQSDTEIYILVGHVDGTWIPYSQLRIALNQKVKKKKIINITLSDFKKMFYRDLKKITDDLISDQDMKDILDSIQSNILSSSNTRLEMTIGNLYNFSEQFTCSASYIFKVVS